MSEQQPLSVMPMPANAGEMWAYVNAIMIDVSLLRDTIKKMFGAEAVDKAEKEVRQDMKEAQIRAQNQDPRVDKLAQSVQQLSEMVLAMPKIMAKEMATQFKQATHTGPHFVKSDDIEDGYEGEDDPEPEPQPQRRKKKKGSIHRLANTTQESRLKQVEGDGSKHTAMAPGGQGAPLGIAGLDVETGNGDDDLEDGFES